MDKHPEHQEPIRQATAQFSKGRYTKLLNIQMTFTHLEQKRPTASKKAADQWKWEEIDAGNWVSKNLKTLKLKKLFSASKVLCAIVNCHQ
jgi:hypothetical protein